MSHLGGVGGIELAGQRAFGGLELLEELGRDGEEVAACEFLISSVLRKLAPMTTVL